METRKQFTVRIPERLLKTVKITAIMEGLPTEKYVERVLEEATRETVLQTVEDVK